jgi:hypothetical protein
MLGERPEPLAAGPPPFAHTAQEASGLWPPGAIERARLLREIYEDLTLCLGGIFAAKEQPIQERLVNEVGKGLRRLYRLHRSRYVEAATVADQDEDEDEDELDETMFTRDERGRA